MPKKAHSTRLSVHQTTIMRARKRRRRSAGSLACWLCAMLCAAGGWSILVVVSSLAKEQTEEIAAVLAVIGSGPLWLLSTVFLHAGLKAQKNRNIRIMQQRSLRARREIVDAVRAGETPPPFFLYLRPFYSDELLIENPDAGWLPFLPDHYYAPAVTWESLFVDRIEAFGRMVSLGQTSDSLSADRIESDDDSWMSSFILLASFAERIFIWPSTRPGTRWEIEWLRERSLLSKCIFVVPSNHDRLGESWDYVRAFLLTIGLNPPIPPGLSFAPGTEPVLTKRLNILRRRKCRQNIREILSATSEVQDPDNRRETWRSAETALRNNPPRLQTDELEILLACVQCGGALDDIVCRNCESAAGIASPP